jgi:hypothetical protein
MFYRTIMINLMLNNNKSQNFNSIFIPINLVEI